MRLIARAPATGGELIQGGSYSARHTAGEGVGVVMTTI